MVELKEVAVEILQACLQEWYGYWQKCETAQRNYSESGML
jgi:hypothetical protein